ncbi:relaxase/mobilization nuclease domain-containing protein [Gammaproteobacteria bacterium AS21]
MICERQGEALKPSTHTGKITYSNQQYVIAKIKYLVSADPKHKHSALHERVALVEGINTLPFIGSEDPELFAEQFTNELYQFTDTYRANKRPPKEIVVDRVISFSPEDDVTPELALKIVREAVAKVMKPLDNRLGLFAVHTDKKHTHVHFLISTVSIDGRIFNPRDDDKAWNKEMNRLEIKHQLTQVGSRDKSAKKKPTNKALQKKKRTGELTYIEKHQQVIDLAIEKANSDFFLFLKLLAAGKMQPIANMKKIDSQVRGMSFFMNDELFAGGTLGTAFRWGNLKKKIGFDDQNPNHSATLFNLMKMYEQQSKLECSISSSDSPIQEEELYENVQTLFDYKPEAFTDLPKPKLKSKKSVLYRAFTHEYIAGDIVYFWRPRKNEAFREVQDRNNAHRIITKNGLNKTVCEAMIERAKELGWRSITVTGSEKFKELIVKQAIKNGIEVRDENGVSLTVIYNGAVKGKTLF